MTYSRRSPIVGLMRVALPLLLLLAACRRTPDVATGKDAIACTLAGKPATCAVERPAAGGLLVRHPDGGFRRLAITPDGRGVVAADGADAARVSIVGAHRIEIAIGDDRYRLPDTLVPAAAP